MDSHKLKIKEEYAIEINAGNKTFEIRNNDRNFQIGDIVHFQVLKGDSWTLDVLEFEIKIFKITYITDFEQKEGYVVFGIKELKQGARE